MINWILKLNEIIKGIEITVTGGYAIFMVACYLIAIIGIFKVFIR